MKKIFSILSMALIAGVMMAQQPVITYEKTEHDFGKIHEEDGRVTVVFTFRNEGMSPLILSNVRASCGCTTPDWTKEPVEPGQTGSIKVTYNPNGRPGRFQKTVTVTSNATEPTTKVYIKGEVIPKPAKPVNKYTIEVGALNMKEKVLNLGTIYKGQNKNGELEIANLKQEEHTVDLATNAADSYMIHQVTLPTIKPNETGKFIFAIETAKNNLYGPIEAYAYVVVDGKKEISDAYKLTIKANIVEDFSGMTVEDKQQAPIIEVQSEYSGIKIPAGKVQKVIIPIKNSGVNPLEIRRAYSTDSHLTMKAPKAIKSGKKGALTVDINTKDLEANPYEREIVIISNDYQNSVKRIKIKFVVE